MYDQRVGTGGKHLVSVNRCRNALTHKRVLRNVVCDAPELRSSLSPTDLVLSIWGFGTGLNSREMVDPVCYICNAHEYDAHYVSRGVGICLKIEVGSGGRKARSSRD